MEAQSRIQTYLHAVLPGSYFIMTGRPCPVAKIQIGADADANVNADCVASFGESPIAAFLMRALGSAGDNALLPVCKPG